MESTILLYYVKKFWHPYLIIVFFVIRSRHVFGVGEECTPTRSLIQSINILPVELTEIHYLIIYVEQFW